MRSWFEFGYDGFPGGAQRRRFYQQRDDPCDSEEERDNDDESGDRPVLHLPLPKYASLSTSSRASSYQSAEDCDAEESGLVSTTALVGTTVSDITPARYGATAVTLLTAATRACHPKRRFVIEHGGVCVATQRVVNDFAVAELATSACNGGLVQYTAATHDPTLSQRFTWEALHPGLVTDSPTCPSCRYGHCAVALDGYTPALVAARLAKPPDADRESPSSSLFPPLSSDPPPRLLSPSPEEAVSLSLVLGGGSSLRGGTGVSLAAAATSPLTRAMPATSVSGLTLNDPLLVLTLIATSAEPGGTSRYTTACFPLGGSAALYLPPRLFATLSPWPISATAPPAEAVARHIAGVGMSSASSASVVSSSSASAVARVHRFAYLGGSSDGVEPLPLFAVTQLELDTATWNVHHAVLETYGTEPAARFGHSASRCGHQLYVFGGVGRHGEVLKDLFLLDTDTLVWREVFIPSNYDVPRRAFHSAVVVPSWQRQQRLRLEAEARSRCGALCVASTSSRDHSSPKDTHIPAGEFFLLLVGGETTGGSTVAPVWGVNLGTHEWRRCDLRTRRCLHTPPAAASPSSPPQSPAQAERGRPSSESTRLHRVLCSLADREAARQAALTSTCHAGRHHNHHNHHNRQHYPGQPVEPAFPVLPSVSRTDDNFSVHYFGAFVGALATAVILNEWEEDEHETCFEASRSSSSCVGVRFAHHRRDHHGRSATATVVLWGGTRSPPVQLLTQVDFPGEDVRMQCCLWLSTCDASRPGDAVAAFVPVLRRLLPSTLLAGSPLVSVGHARGQRSDSTSQDVATAATDDRDADNADMRETESPRTSTPSALAQQAVELGNLAAVEDQLADWQRAALKRLRDR